MGRCRVAGVDRVVFCTLLAVDTLVMGRCRVAGVDRVGRIVDVKGCNSWVQAAADADATEGSAHTGDAGGAGMTMRRLR